MLLCCEVARNVLYFDPMSPHLHVEMKLIERLCVNELSDHPQRQEQMVEKKSVFHQFVMNHIASHH